MTQDRYPGHCRSAILYTRRTPWFTQTDSNFAHMFKVNKNNEHQTLSFKATVQNLFNQRALFRTGRPWPLTRPRPGLYPRELEQCKVERTATGPYSVARRSIKLLRLDTNCRLRRLPPRMCCTGVWPTEPLAASASTAFGRPVQLLTFNRSTKKGEPGFPAPLFFVRTKSRTKTLAPRIIAGLFSLCAEHVRQLGGESPLPDLVEVKG